MWAKLHWLVFDALGARLELDWSRCAIGRVNLWGLKGSWQLAAAKLVDRGEFEPKIHSTAERTGPPPSQSRGRAPC